MNRKLTTLISSAMLVTALNGCSLDFNDDDDNGPVAETMMKYSVTISNITSNQPFSPPAAMLHSAGVKLWQLGTPASVALEELAEGGSSMKLTNLTDIKMSSVASGPVLSGDATQLMVEQYPSDNYHLSVATMLVNTNDAFTGLIDLPIAELAVGEKYSMLVRAYDAGTEENTETAATMPGPAAGGEGYNASRANDVDRVYVHAGVLTEVELASSVLKVEHKFDNPVAKIMIERLQ